VAIEPGGTCFSAFISHFFSIFLSRNNCSVTTSYFYLLCMYEFIFTIRRARQIFLRTRLVFRNTRTPMNENQREPTLVVRDRDRDVLGLGHVQLYAGRAQHQTYDYARSLCTTPVQDQNAFHNPINRMTYISIEMQTLTLSLTPNIYFAILSSSTLFP
jgi:hypothetical protein